MFCTYQLKLRQLFLSFILSLFYFLTICANFTFCLRLYLCLRHITLPPLSIACKFQRVLHFWPSIHQPLPLHQYDNPVQVGSSCCWRVDWNCLWQRKTLLPLASSTDTLSTPPLMPPPLSLPLILSPPYQATLRSFPHRFRHSSIYQIQNRHRPRWRPDWQPRPHWRHCHLTMCPCQVH